ncbi:N5-glutamine methyltransferase family protein [Photorhabdus antumapuensis]|uniref:N5-glutamine methyltransferase family protein n=1 Tax=Photorhabdus antumapuensis TaxID=2862867 RepID=UPI001CEC452D|nr:methyltransferase [Photorhabdus antumapuensis]MCA6221503.1 methyltransferase [Photorhabdus antumapuensis]
MENLMVDDICLRARWRLSEVGIVSARAEVDLLKQHFLTGQNPNIEGFLNAVADREKRIPLGYILEYAYFDGAKLQVAKDTFVPREQSLPLIEDICSRAERIDVHRITDICAGVGPLGISLSRRLKCSSICFVEFRQEARAVLHNNVRAFVPKHCAAVISGCDIFTMDPIDERCSNSQIVVANPPFVPLGQASMPEFAIHHPKDAIFSGIDGTDAVKRCCELAREFLAEGGLLGIEHHESQVSFVDVLLRRLGFTDVRHFPDGDGKMRITTAVLGVAAIKPAARLAKLDK